MARSKTLLTTILLVLFSLSSFAQEEKYGLTWYNDINQVYKLSTQTKKPVFAFFTGSDWCGWCKRLIAVVFEKPGFQAWAKKNVILLELDFPRRTQLPENIAKQNSELQQFFKIQGYPTVWLFTMSKDKGKDKSKYSINGLGSLGYPSAEQGKEEETFLATANEILKKKNASK